MLEETEFNEGFFMTQEVYPFGKIEKRIRTDRKETRGGGSLL